MSYRKERVQSVTYRRVIQNEDRKKTTEILVSTTKPVSGVVFNISTRL